MALTTKYFNATVTTGVSFSGTVSRASTVTSTIYIVPSGRNAKVKLIYASLTIPTAGFAYPATSSAVATIYASALLNIAGAANFSTGATSYGSMSAINFGGSVGWGYSQTSGGTGNFLANANAPISLANYEVKGQAASSAAPFGYAVGINPPPPGFLLINSSSLSYSTTSTFPNGAVLYMLVSGKTASYTPQNFFLTSGQSIDITAQASISINGQTGAYASAVSSVAILVIEEAANG